MTDSKTQLPADRYWATEPAEAMPAILEEQFRRYWRGLDDRGIPAVWQRFYRMYYGQDAEGGYASSHAIGFGGEQGEAIRLRSNHLRSLWRRFLTMATSDRPEYIASAANDGSNAQGQVTLVRQLLDAALDDGGVETSVVTAAEMVGIYADGYVVQTWDENAGEPVAVEATIDPATGQVVQKPVMAGDTRIEAYTPVDIAADLDAAPRSKPQWFIVRRWEKKWDLLAEHPEHEAAILSAATSPDLTRGLWEKSRRDGGDWIATLTLYHDRTKAVGSGRKVKTIAGATLEDAALLEPDLPIHRIRPSSELEMDTGYSDFWDLLASQDAYDAIMSAIVNVIDVTGAPTLLAAEGQEINDRALATGGRVVYWRNDGKSDAPIWMQPPEISASTMQAREVVLSDLETNSGVNSVARGSSNENTKAASSQALMQSMAVQYASHFVRAVVKLYRDLANAQIKLWQRFAKAPRIVEIAGPDERPVVAQFKGSDIGSIRQVRIDVGPANLRTLLGKIEAADKLLAAYGPEVVPPEKYMQVYSTGRFQPVYKRQLGQVRSISAENEALMDGQEVAMLKTDNHVRHIQEHACLLDDPKFRFTPGSSIVNDHILAHAVEYDRMRHEEPALWAMTQEPLPPAMMEMLMAMGVAPPGAPVPEGGPQGDPAAPLEEDEGQPGAPRAEPPGAPAGGDLPLMPTDPSTGERMASDGRPQVAAGGVA